ncbi:hypothetical protein HK099_003175, partial [Clydaea vesicula]
KFSSNTPFGTKPFNNIIATKDPSAQRKLILAAHYDSKYFEEFDFIGATDSAVPCAIILDVAKSLNKYFDERLDRLKSGYYDDKDNGFILNDLPTLQLIFFDGEEAFKSWTSTDSLYGSRHLAEKWGATFVVPDEAKEFQGAASRSKSILSQIDAFILLDLLGTKEVSMFNTHPETQYIWDRIANVELRLWEENLLSSIQSQKFLASGEQYGYFISGWTPYSYSKVDDDHRPFRDKGVPCVHVIPQPFPKVWHTIHDNEDAIEIDVVSDYCLIFRTF